MDDWGIVSEADTTELHWLGEAAARLAYVIAAGRPDAVIQAARAAYRDVVRAVDVARQMERA
jgi:hypothetical protein